MLVINLYNLHSILVSTEFLFAVLIPTLESPPRSVNPEYPVRIMVRAGFSGVGTSTILSADFSVPPTSAGFPEQLINARSSCWLTASSERSVGSDGAGTCGILVMFPIAVTLALGAIRFSLYPTSDCSGTPHSTSSTLDSDFERGTCAEAPNETHPSRSAVCFSYQRLFRAMFGYTIGSADLLNNAWLSFSRIKAATVKSQERLMLYTLGEHVFEVGADSSEQGPEA